jgi:hypothetical protein
MGTYLLHIAGHEGEEMVAAQTRGFVMAYSPEYRSTQMDAALLPDLAAIGSGQVLSLDAPAEAFAHTLPPVRGTTDLWAWFLTTAILLLPLDVGLRRIIFGREDVQQLWAKLQDRLPKPQTVPRPAVSSAGRLLQVKEKQRAETSAEIAPKRVGQTSKQRSVSALSDRMPLAHETDPQAGTQERASETSSQAGPTTAEPEVEEETTVRRLMRVKQKRREGKG